MSTFDKICAVLTIPIGALFLVSGFIGLFVGSSAHFDLPPVLGFFPFLLGWSMCVTLVRFWRKPGSEVGKEEERKVNSKLFGVFLHLYPEFKAADARLQWNAFHKWVNNPESFDSSQSL